jgi:hypothetical protein
MEQKKKLQMKHKNSLFTLQTFHYLSFSENFEFRHFRPHYLDVDTIFGDLGVNVNIRNTIFRKDPPSVVSGYGKRSINLNKVKIFRE